MNEQIIVTVVTENGGGPLFSYSVRQLCQVPVTGDRVRYDGIFSNCVMPVAEVMERAVTHQIAADDSIMLYGVQITVRFPFDGMLKEYLKTMEGIPARNDRQLPSCVFLKEHEKEITYDDVVFISANYRAFHLSEEVYSLLEHYLWRMKYSPFSI